MKFAVGYISCGIRDVLEFRDMLKLRIRREDG